MNCLYEPSSHLEQPPIPPIFTAPEAAVWPEEQPNSLRLSKAPLATLAADTYWQEVNRAPVSGNATKSLDDVYVIENRALVTAFIERNRLRGLLLQAVCALNNSFGDAMIKTLKLLQDDEGSETLFCIVTTLGDMGEAMRALRFFDDSWWLAHCNQVAGKMNFDFELV